MRTVTFFQTKKVLNFAYIIIFLVTADFNTAFGQSERPQSIPEALKGATDNFYSIKERFTKYCADQGIKDGNVLKNGNPEKVPYYNIFKRWEYYWEQRINPATGEFPSTTALDELKKEFSNPSKTNSFNESWTPMGTNVSAGGYAGIGRVNTIAFHPTDSNVFWIGTPSGGMWKTTDGGTSWTIVNTGFSNPGVSSIAIPYNFATSNIMYIATGDKDVGSVWTLGSEQAADNPSTGVFKSTDGGATWNATSINFTTSQGKSVYKVYCGRPTVNIVIALTSSGIYKSTDYGTTWALKSSAICYDIVSIPGYDDEIMCASSTGSANTYVYRSTDFGSTWATALTVPNSARGALAISQNTQGIAYLVATNTGGGVAGIYKSADLGIGWSQVNTNTSQAMFGYYSDGRGSNTGQGWYDLCIAASPTNPNLVFIGGTNNWKSTDGGVTWTICNMWTRSTGYNFVNAPEVHADKHFLAFRDANTLFECNDGGVYYTTNGGTTWNDKTNGLAISQIYRIGVSKTDATKVLAGLQDNGSKKYNGGVNTWTDVYGGDGMECIIDNSDATSYMYVTYVNGQIYRNSNGFSTSATTPISIRIPGGQPTGAWVTPYIMDPTNSLTLWAGYNQVWKTTDRGNTWVSASQTLSTNDKLRSIAVAPSNTNVLYAADLSGMWKTTDGGATNWSTITLPSTSNSVTYIAVKNDDPNTVWITYGGYSLGSKVYQSTDGGATWANISTGLPNIPVMCIVQQKNETSKNQLFAGTDVGVYVKDGLNNWAAINTGLPNIVVTELEIFYGNPFKLRAATFGRGLWETDLTAPLPVELTSFTGKLSEKTAVLNWETATELKNLGYDIERAVKTADNSKPVWKKIGFINGFGTSSEPHSYTFRDNSFKESGSYLYRLKQIDNDGAFYYSPIIEVAINLPLQFALEQNYPNPFNSTSVISYQTASENQVTLKVYDALGTEVAVLVDERKPAGIYSVNFDAIKLASGVYYCRMTAGSFMSVRKLVLLK